MNTATMNAQLVHGHYVGRQAPSQQELRLARNIQRRLLPHQLPTSPYFKVHAFTVPCSGVGGDYYDAIALPGGRSGFTVADVSGKGLPAAILSANLQGSFAAVAADDLELPEVFRRVNNSLFVRSSEEMFATMFYGVVSLNGDFDFVNAGHTYPLVVRGNGTLQRLEASNVPLGLFFGIAFQPGKIHLDPEDLVLLFSDGLVEAQDLMGDLFGQSRLNDVAKECARLPAVSASRRILRAVRSFVGAASPSDDLTLLVMRFGFAQCPAEEEAESGIGLVPGANETYSLRLNAAHKEA